MQHRSGIQKRTLTALRCITNGDLEEAFLHLATAIDSTSKRHYPGAGNRKRYCDYLHKHQEDMFWIATSGTLVVLGGFGHPVTKEVIRIADAIYAVRCASIHDPEELGKLVAFVIEGKFGFDQEGRFLINSGMLTALALLVLTDPANRTSLDRFELSRFGGLKHGQVHIDLTACIGGRTRLLNVYRGLNQQKKGQVGKDAGIEPT
ncbi:MAG: hypothetical protein IPO79_04260 [Flavobacteriales bacterium]|nr:hypothetical protein [Flavobacteriales bacterium]